MEKKGLDTVYFYFFFQSHIVAIRLSLGPLTAHSPLSVIVPSLRFLPQGPCTIDLY